jgi:phosphoserine phosphatase RsbU/P
MNSIAIRTNVDRILVADDEASNRTLLGLMLRGEPCQISYAADGPSTLTLAQAESPDLILLDVMMPGIDGFEVCAQLKANPATCQIPVIFLSALADTSNKVRGLNLGAIDYITKPFDLAEVLARVRVQLKIGGLTRDLTAANQLLMQRGAKIDSDLRAAADIQKALLPDRISKSFPGCEVDWRCLPCDQVGGDLCNYYWLDKDHLAAYVMDVSGHGVPAAMLTVAIARNLVPPQIAPRDNDIREVRAAGYSPGQFLRQLDRDYPMERFGKFFTMVYVVLNRRTGELRYSSGGHPMPIVVRADGRRQALHAGGTVIGCGASLPFEEGTEHLGVGDSIVLYSDGVSECEGSVAGGRFGDHRLDAVLKKKAGHEASDICDGIVDDLVAYHGSERMYDDVTIMAIRYQETPVKSYWN